MQADGPVLERQENQQPRLSNQEIREELYQAIDDDDQQLYNEMMDRMDKHSDEGA